MSEDDQLAKLDELLDCEEGLTAWEMDFLESLDKQRGRTFTDAQIEKLEEIYARVI